MAITLVQSVKAIVTGVSFTTLAYGSNVTAGNLLCNSHSHWSLDDNAINTPSDTLTHTHVPMVAEQAIGAFNKLRSFYVANCSGGANTVTFDIASGDLGDITVVVAEFSGAATTTPLGVTASGTGTGTEVSSGNTATLDQPTGMLWGAMIHSGADTTIAETGGATIVQENEGGTSNMPIGVSYELTTATTAQDATWTVGASRTWAAHVAFLKAALVLGDNAPTARSRARRPEDDDEDERQFNEVDIRYWWREALAI